MSAFEFDNSAAAIAIADAANDFTATDVEGALAELQADHETDAAALTTHGADTTSVHGITDTSALALTANVQPIDSDLTAIAALTTTSFGRGLLELANQAALLSAAGAAAASHAHAGEDITSGTIADVRIASTIARDSEVTSAISTSESGQVRDGDTAGGVLGGTYPNPSFAADMATQAELDAHTGDSSAAHAASAISADSTTLVGTGTDVQAVLEELDNAIAAVSGSGSASFIPAFFGGG